MVPIDGMEYAGWAMKDPEKDSIALADICETEVQARELCRMQRKRQPHRGWCDAVPIRITLTEVKS